MYRLNSSWRNRVEAIVFDKPYRFVPPCEGRIWPAFVHRLFPLRPRRAYGVVDTESHGLEHLRSARAAGDGVVLAPNHCRPCDPFVVSEVARRAGAVPFTLASWHLFMQGRIQS